MDTFVEEHLARTSRTFALAVPELEPRLCHAVGVAYLLFRVADTLEDAALWSAGARVEALADFVALLDDPDPARAAALASKFHAARPVDHEGYLDLLAALPRLMAELGTIEPAARAVITAHVARTARGMAEITASAARGDIDLHTLGEVRHYCYVVAGIVGEMLTELFLLDQPQLARCAATLRADAPRFGEGLQLVNILKDARDDAREGRRFLPEGVSLGEVRALARDDLRAATRYTEVLQSAGASRGIVMFAAMPIVLAYATLAAVELHGPGAKVSRPELFALLGDLRRRIDAGVPAITGDVDAALPPTGTA
ncbi:MAG: squalene/phytoene synthase family protein [Minicystis sp.]